RSTLFIFIPYTTLFRSLPFICYAKEKLTVTTIKKLMSSHYQGTSFDPYYLERDKAPFRSIALNRNLELHILQIRNNVPANIVGRSEEHTSELQSRFDVV